MMNLETKLLIHEQCLTILQTKIDELSQTIVDMSESMMAEAKSTMGDKYETSRAMIQSEIERIGLQRSEAIRQLQNIQILDPNKSNSLASRGALVNTGQALYYLGAPIGKVDIDNKAVFVISPQSPIGQLILDKKKGDKIEFNGKTITIKEII
ncbi:MAG: GreA/GreB family elongation factor [Cyclobacteriaceae bacterium]